MSHTIGVIGCGVMGSAIIHGLLDNKVYEALHIFGCEHDPEKRSQLGEKFGIRMTDDVELLVKECDMILLAVKPQVASDVFVSLKDKVSDHVLLSIMAGVNIKKMQSETGCQNIVRIMPNTPAQIGEGVSGWFASESVTEEHKEQVRKILAACGKEFELNSEEMIDKITAVTGSGPAYVFYFAEQMILKAIELGFEKDKAEAMVKQLFLGSVHLWDQSGDTPATLRENVTSKGGTTTAALGVMENKQLSNIVGEAMDAAYKRAGELGEG